MEEMKALQIAEAQQSISPQRIPEYPVANTGANIKEVWNPNPPANLNSVGSQYEDGPVENLNLAMKQALVDAGVGTGGNSNAIKDTGIMTQGLGYQPAPTSIFDGGGYQEGVFEDLNLGFGTTPQAPRSEYFGPTNWNPGIGNQDHTPDPVKEYEQKVAESGSILDTKQIKKAAKQQAGQKFGGHPSAGVTYPAPSNIIQAVQGYDGRHPSATEPPSSYDPRIDGMIKEVKGRDESVFTTIDDLIEKGGYTQDEIMAGTDKSDPFWMSQDGVTDIPVDLGLTDAQVEQILNPSISGESFIRNNPQYAPIGTFDEPLYDGGTLAESPFVGPHDYATGNIQDASSSLDPRVLAGLNQQAIGHITDPSGIAGYAAGLPQQVNENPEGYVDSRDMQGYLEGEALKESEYLSGLPTTGPAGATYGPQDISQGLITSQHPWAERRNSVSLPRQRVPYSGERVQWNPGMASIERAQDERDSNVQMLKFLESRGLGSSQEAQDIRRTL